MSAAEIEKVFQTLKLSNDSERPVLPKFDESSTAPQIIYFPISGTTPQPKQR